MAEGVKWALRTTFIGVALQLSTVLRGLMNWYTVNDMNSLAYLFASALVLGFLMSVHFTLRKAAILQAPKEHREKMTRSVWL